MSIPIFFREILHESYSTRITTSLQEPNICVPFPLSTWSPEGHDQRVGTELAYFCDENWAMHRKQEQRTRECVRCEIHCSVRE